MCPRQQPQKTRRWISVGSQVYIRLSTVTLCARKSVQKHLGFWEQCLHPWGHHCEEMCPRGSIHKIAAVKGIPRLRACNANTAASVRVSSVWAWSYPRKCTVRQVGASATSKVEGQGHMFGIACSMHNNMASRGCYSCSLLWQYLTVHISSIFL